jgi:hypothetical protein
LPLRYGHTCESIVNRNGWVHNVCVCLSVTENQSLIDFFKALTTNMYYFIRNCNLFMLNNHKK